jgi:hypothetical protein
LWPAARDNQAVAKIRPQGKSLLYQSLRPLLADANIGEAYIREERFETRIVLPERLGQCDEHVAAYRHNAASEPLWLIGPKTAGIKRNDRLKFKRLAPPLFL